MGVADDRALRLQSSQEGSHRVTVTRLATKCFAKWPGVPEASCATAICLLALAARNSFCCSVRRLWLMPTPRRSACVRPWQPNRCRRMAYGTRLRASEVLSLSCCSGWAQQAMRMNRWVLLPPLALHPWSWPVAVTSGRAVRPPCFPRASSGSSRGAQTAWASDLRYQALMRWPSQHRVTCGP